MLKTLLRDAVIYGASTVISRAVSLLIVPVYTRVLSPAEYGAIDILSIFGNLITLTVALEIGQAVARFLPDADQEADRRRLVSTASIFTVGAYTAFLVLGFVFLDPLGRLLVGGDTPTVAVALALTSTWAIGVFQLGQNVLRFLLRPVAYMVASLLFSLGGIAVGVVLVVGFDAGVAGVFAGQTVGGLLGASAVAWFTRELYRPRFDMRSLRQMLGFSVPLVPASLGVFVTLYVDRLALNALTSLSAVGIFGIAYRLAAVVSLLLIGFQMALMPIVYQRYRDPSTPPELARVFRTFVAFALTISLALSAFAPEILRIITAPAYYAADQVVPLLVPAILLANMYVFMPGLAIAKQTRAIATITIGGAILNTTLNLLLIPILGVRGAALATLVSAFLVFSAYVRTSQRSYPVPHRWAPLGVVVLAYAALAAFTSMLEPMTIASAALKFLCVAALGGFAFWAGLVTRGELGRVVSLLRPGARRAI